MENRVMVLLNKKDFGSKAKIAKAEIGKWYCFGKAGYADSYFYGKVVEIIDKDHVKVEKFFEVYSNPYREEKWYDRLPFAVAE